MYRWRLLIEEFGPEIIYIKGVDNTVADAISRLDYNPNLNRHADDEELKKLSKHEKWSNFLLLSSCYDAMLSDTSNESYSFNYSQTFTNNSSDDEIYPLTVTEIADVQRLDPSWKIFFDKKDPKGKIYEMIIDETEVLVYKDSRLVVPKILRARAMQWHHHYLQHPGSLRLKETLATVM